MARVSNLMIYLDNAATSFPKPPCVSDSLPNVLDVYGGSPGRGSYEMARQAEAVIEEARRAVAQLFQISQPRRLAWTLNATDALNMAIKGVIRPGDHVVTTVMEHNSVARPLNRLERDGAIRLSRVPASSDGLVDPDDVRRAMTDRTRLVAVVHASNVTGTLQPIAEIGRAVRRAERLFLVDAAQTAGRYPIDVESACIDLLAFPGHKGLLGPPGTGGLYVGPRAELAPWREGGTGVRSEEPLQPEELPLRLEAGSPNTPGIALLERAVRFLLQHGVEWIRTHELALVERLIERLKEDGRFVVYGPQALATRVAIASVTLAGVLPQEIGEVLSRRFGIAVRAGLHCAPGAHRTIGTLPHGTLRISPGYFTNPADIETCVEALQYVADQSACRPEIRACE